MAEAGDPGGTPAVVAVDMGYGHLRAGQPLADRLGVPLLELDRPPLAGAEEQQQWQRVRWFHESTSRWSQLPMVGGAFRALLGAVTHIPQLYPRRDLSSPTAGTRYLARLTAGGLGRELVQYLVDHDAPLLTTFYAPAVVADHLGFPRVFCVVTDTDINRVWAPIEPARSRATYLAPSRRVVDRLKAYGVSPERIILTGFPLPHELLGGPDLEVARRNLAARLVRLDPRRSFLGESQDLVERTVGPLPSAEKGRAVTLTFAVGGAGAQAELAEQFLPSLRDLLQTARLRVVLIAGRRPEVAATFREAIETSELGEQLGRGIEILHAPAWTDYYRAMSTCLAETDLLWTKPSEMTFYAALGIPLVFSWPVGVHERYNRRWALESGAGLKQREVRHAGDWIAEWLEEGTLAAAAWSGFLRLPKQGLYRILDAVAGGGGR
ncbi:MAG: hypothetical protein IT384_09630 [Deltaproteobacteria bacterium]|nr:hypothetical protein [Deltaproteobacteria bacterium]